MHTSLSLSLSLYIYIYIWAPVKTSYTRPQLKTVKSIWRLSYKSSHIGIPPQRNLHFSHFCDTLATPGVTEASQPLSLVCHWLGQVQGQNYPQLECPSLRHRRDTFATPLRHQRASRRQEGRFGGVRGTDVWGRCDTAANTLSRHRRDRSHSFGVTRASQKRSK